jgi:hypothetical protein
MCWSNVCIEILNEIIFLNNFIFSVKISY